MLFCARKEDSRWFTPAWLSVRALAAIVAAEGGAMNAAISIAVLLLASGAAPDSLSPDGQRTYKCGRERQSAAGCFNAWTRLSHGGKTGEWVPAYCSDLPDEYSNGSCYGGGVPWWWWNGSGRIGDPVLKDFWFRDYAGPEVNGVFRNNNAYGDAHRLPGQHHCYKAKQSMFCMEFMQAR